VTEPRVDPAEVIGRAAGSTVNALGLRLLRLRSVRRALEQAGQEARGDPQTLPSEVGGVPGEAGGGGTPVAEGEA
jgi:hypothetical protein